MSDVIPISESTAIQLVEAINNLINVLQRLNTSSNEPKFLTAKDVSKILKINVNSATELMQNDDFPSLKIGRLKVEEQAFLDWCRQNKKRN